jgi:hypothetical protein
LSEVRHALKSAFYRGIWQENESNLASTNLHSAASGLAATAAMAQAAKTGPKWQRYLMSFFIVVTLLATGVGIVGKLTSIGTIRACAAQETRETLSDLNKQTSSMPRNTISSGTSRRRMRKRRPPQIWHYGAAAPSNTIIEFSRMT